MRQKRVYGQGFCRRVHAAHRRKSGRDDGYALQQVCRQGRNFRRTGARWRRQTLRLFYERSKRFCRFSAGKTAQRNAFVCRQRDGRHD